MFVLLKDSGPTIDGMGMPLSGGLNQRLTSKLGDVVNRHVEEFVTHGLGEILEKIHKTLGDTDYFVVTMDGGTYFQEYDFSFEISRTCLKLNELKNGTNYRFPRQGCSQLITQGCELRQKYEDSGYSRPIALCDDGVSTGESLGRIISILRQINLDITHVFVLINEKQIRSIGETDIVTVYDEYEQNIAWLSERDLIWGAPRSGVSYCNTNDMSTVFGVPYTLDMDIVRRKILDFRDTCGFRDDILEVNIWFWEEVEKQLGKEIRFSSLERIAFLEEIVGDDKRLVEFLESIRGCEYEFVADNACY